MDYTIITDHTSAYQYSYSQTADQHKGDRSILFVLDYPSKCRHYANSAIPLRCAYLASTRGYTAFEIVYLYAYRAANRKALLRAEDPIGNECDWYIIDAAKRATEVVAMWGNDKHYADRVKRVTDLLNGMGVTLVIL